MKLVIVESPKKCETIKGYLGSEYKVLASQGHIRDLSTHGKGGLGINVEHDFEPDFVISPEKKRIVDTLIKESKKAEEVILATDPDREGEAISWHLAQVLHLPLSSTKRLQFHEITKPAIEEAMKNPRHIDMNLVSSQETRRMYDRIIGFKLSGLLQRKISSKSAGRVQSVTLRMICDNDEEIASFVPQEYWTIEVTFVVEGKMLTCMLDRIDGKPAEIHTQKEAEDILSRIFEEGTLVSLQKIEKHISSKPAFTTSTMQQEAYNRYRFTPSRTQALAQRLYEGADVEGEKVGLITYMRTDSTRISPEFYEHHAKPFILERFGKEYLGKVKGMKSVGRVQDAHEAIRPTSTHRTPEVVKPYLTSDEYKVYKLIYERALASMMSDKIEEQQVALFDINGLTFKAQGSKTLFIGYQKLLKDEEGERKELPYLEEGKTYSVHKKDAEQKFTKAPARFTEARVVRLMEEKGIGRPSTYASTLKTLKDRGYVTSDKGVLTPTESGKKTTLVLKKYFPEVVSPEYTANMETKLDEIEEGSETRLQAMNEFYFPFMEKFTKVEEQMYKDPDEETGESCPLCGKPLVVKKGRYGPFVACSGYPTCHYIKKEEKKIVFTGESCPLCGKPLVERYDRKGRKFVGCSGYPTCHYIEGNEKEKEQPVVVKKCPDCKEGNLVIRHSKKGDFLGCTNFPKCRHIEPFEKKND